MVRDPFRSTASGHGFTPCRAKMSSIAARSAASSVQSSAAASSSTSATDRQPDERRAHARRRGRPPQRELRRPSGRASPRASLQVVDRRRRCSAIRPGPKRCSNSGDITPHLSVFDRQSSAREGVVGGQGAAQEPVGERAVAEEADVVARRTTGASSAPSAGRTGPYTYCTTSTGRIFAHACTSSRVKFESATKRTLPARTTSSSAPQRLLERSVAVGPVHGVHVDVVGAEASAGWRRSTRAHARRGRRGSWVGPVYPVPNLVDDDRLVAPAPQRPPERLLRRAEAVRLGGVEEVDADVERVADRAGELALVDVAVAAADLLAAEADRRHLARRWRRGVAARSRTPSRAGGSARGGA